MNTVAAHAELPCGFDVAEDDDIHYTQWLRAKVQRALDDPRPRIPHAQAMARIRRSIEEVAQETVQGHD